MFLDVTVKLTNFKIKHDLEYILYTIYFLLFFNGLHGIISRIYRSKNGMNCFGVYHNMFNWHAEGEY